MLTVAAIDAKGGLIHQTSKAENVQRSDESSDLRLFRIRMPAFFNAFSEEASLSLLSRFLIDAFCSWFGKASPGIKFLRKKSVYL